MPIVLRVWFSTNACTVDSPGWLLKNTVTWSDPERFQFQLSWRCVWVGVGGERGGVPALAWLKGSPDDSNCNHGSEPVDLCLFEIQMRNN